MYIYIYMYVYIHSQPYICVHIYIYIHMILIHGCTNTLMYFQRFKTLTIHCWQTDRTL